MAACVAGLWTAALAAQDNTTVGNPQLKNFQLPGQRTTPPAQPQPQPPATAAPRPAPPAATGAAGAPAASAAGSAVPPAARTPARRPPPPAARSAPLVQRAPAAPVPAPVARTPVPQAAPPPASTAPAPSQAAPAPAPSSGFGLKWLWLAVPVLLGLLAFAFLRRRRANEEGETENELLLVAEAAATAAPEPAPQAAPRPWLEVDIEPDRAAATDSEASLNYMLVVTNVGDAPARNIRIDTRMFNAADEQAIAAFLGGSIHRHSGSPHVALPPAESLRLAAEIAMKADEVRAIELQGRSIFVPSVAVNVAYDWGEDGEGRTSKSWLVGRKPDNPAARMGAFRLDLGPRIYRSVGRRDGKRVMV